MDVNNALDVQLQPADIIYQVHRERRRRCEWRCARPRMERVGLTAAHRWVRRRCHAASDPQQSLLFTTGICLASAEVRPDTARRVTSRPRDSFEVVRRIGLTLPDVEAATRYDGFPVLKIAGVFMAGLATHPSAEPDTLVVRADVEERECFIQDAPETYYLTDDYRSYPVVLVRLRHVTREALRELLSASRRLTLPKTRRRRRSVPLSDRSGRHAVDR